MARRGGPSGSVSQSPQVQELEKGAAVLLSSTHSGREQGSCSHWPDSAQRHQYHGSSKVTCEHMRQKGANRRCALLSSPSVMFDVRQSQQHKPVLGGRSYKGHPRYPDHDPNHTQTPPNHH